MSDEKRNMEDDKREPAAKQLQNWSRKKQEIPINKQEQDYITSEAGIDVPFQTSSITVGKRGPIVLADFNMIEQQAHFNRERIPERVVHAKGAGAFGYFQVTHDITDYTVAKVFECVGKKTRIGVRFSQVFGNLGSADTVRDTRGFAIKFYTEDGNWDLVGNNTPIFFVRDPILFPMVIRVQKCNPVTNLRDWDMFWDFFSLRQETVHQLMVVFSDRGIPDGHRHQHGFGCHTFSLIGEDRKLTWCKFIYKTDQGIKNLATKRAQEIAGQDPDYAVRDLYNAIENGKKTGIYPSWTFYVQLMSPEQAAKLDFDPFDITKVWPHDEFPLKQVGKIVLNENPGNFFADVEQIALNPNNLIPGIGASPDRLLQGRLFAYQDAHRYRLGVNYQQLPVNSRGIKINNYQRDGSAAIDNQNGAPNYYPNSFGGVGADPRAMSRIPPPQDICGLVDYHDNSVEDADYEQPRKLWRKVLNEAGKEALVRNLANSLKLASTKIRNRAIGMFSKVDDGFGEKLKYAVKTALDIQL